jgi:periplasmic protein CpxP/Spy
MNMKTGIRMFAIVAAVATTLGLAAITASAHMGDEGQPPTGRHFKKMSKELGLTSKQQDGIKAIFEKNRPLVKPLIQQMMTERRALRSLVQADTIDEAAIRAQSAKVAAIQADLAVQRAHTGQDIRALLTPDQILKFKTLQAKRDNRHGKLRSCADHDMSKGK